MFRVLLRCIYQTIAYSMERCLLRVLTVNDIRMTLTLMKTDILVSSITQELQRFKRLQLKMKLHA
jgi:hypothetical protein